MSGFTFEQALANEVSPTPTDVTIAIDEKTGDEHDDAYYRKLLVLVLEKTVPAYGPYKIHIVPFIYVDSRLLRAVEENKVSVTWRHFQEGVTLPLLPIKIDLLKKLGNYRIFLIRRDDQERFSEINSLKDLRKLRGGMGAQWPDRIVMEKNDLPLVLNVNYFNLFKMLRANRFDYLSRGIYQVLPELSVKENQELVLEQHLLLEYENPLYFFVNKKNTLLAKRLETGLNMAIADGSLNEIFNQFPRFAWAQKILDEQNRVVLKLMK
jgi:hypothetical protein